MEDSGINNSNKTGRKRAAVTVKARETR